MNPDELVWGWAKYGQLSNWAPPDADTWWDEVFSTLYDLREQPHLLASFINQVNLPLRL